MKTLAQWTIPLSHKTSRSNKMKQQNTKTLQSEHFICPDLDCSYRGAATAFKNFLTGKGFFASSLIERLCIKFR